MADECGNSYKISQIVKEKMKSGGQLDHNVICVSDVFSKCT